MEENSACEASPTLFPVVSGFAGKSGTVFKISAISQLPDRMVAAGLEAQKKKKPCPDETHLYLLIFLYSPATN